MLTPPPLYTHQVGKVPFSSRLPGAPEPDDAQCNNHRVLARSRWQACTPTRGETHNGDRLKMEVVCDFYALAYSRGWTWFVVSSFPAIITSNQI